MIYYFNKFVETLRWCTLDALSTEMKPIYDVAIIGAGPAGTACALAMKNSGLDVLLIDKSSFPRDKICGDAIPGPAFKLLNQMDPSWGNAMREFSDTAHVQYSKGYSPNGETFTVGWETFSYNSKRVNFDHFLFELVQKDTQADIVLNKQLKKIEQHDSFVDCQFQDGTFVQAKIVIGCDGGRSLVGRTLANYDIKKEEPFVAMRAYYQNVRDVQTDTNEFHFFKEIMPGYFWIFPVDDNWVNVGFGLLAKTTDKAAPNMKRTLDHIINEHPSIAPRFKEANLKDPIKGCALPISTQERTISGERFMLCGDAASLINPIGGHGIDTAMWSGYYAAQQVLQCFQKDNFSAEFMKSYDQRIHEKFKKGFNKNYKRVQFLMKFPFLINWIFNNGKLIKRLIKL